MDEKCKGCFDRDAIFHKGMKRGVELVLEKAVEVEVIDDWEYGKDADHSPQPAVKLRDPDLKIREKVKIVIIRDNESE